jgi:hypothetical protein
MCCRVLGGGGQTGKGLGRRVETVGEHGESTGQSAQSTQSLEVVRRRTNRTGAEPRWGMAAPREGVVDGDAVGRCPEDSGAQAHELSRVGQGRVPVMVGTGPVRRGAQEESRPRRGTPYWWRSRRVLPMIATPDSTC